MPSELIKEDLDNKIEVKTMQSSKPTINKKLKASSKVPPKKVMQQPILMSNADQQMYANMQMNNVNNLPQQIPQMPQMQILKPVQQLQQTSFPTSNVNRNISGGFYGKKPVNLQGEVYNDDEALIERVKEESKNAKIEIEIRAQRSLVKLKNLTELPAMATLKTSGGNRTSVDLICVIDNSGSMTGQKIGLVKETIKFLLQTLTPSDRLSIITFNSMPSRLCGLKCVTGENMQGFTNLVDGIAAGGGTNINSGLQLALKTIRERKHINKVTSIFLLSDGQDKGAEFSFKQSLEEARNKQLGVFTLHSFGFGSDHDQDLMTRLCETKDGAFYFIKQLATLDEAFCNALGGIISLVANEVTLKVSNIAKNIVEGIKIKKVYGNMWQKINDKEYKIKISQLMSGITKDFVFQLEIPVINTQVGDVDRDHKIIEGIFTAKGVNNEIINGQCLLELTLLNENEEIPDKVENVDVIQNYLRVKAAEAISQNLKKADLQKYEQAQQGIDKMITEIQTNKKARKEKMDFLINDLQQIKQKCSKQDWAQEGRKWMKNAQVAHSKQNNFQYSNCIQAEMVSQRKAKKMG